MIVLRLGSTCSMQVSSEMPPHKRIKNEHGYTEVVNVASSGSETEEEGRGRVRYSSDWRDRCKSVCDKYSYALRNHLLTDVTLIVGDRHPTPFHAHRLILALGSPVFQAMFYGELAERGESVTIPDVDPEGFRHLLRYLYTGEYDERPNVSVFKTFFAADKYCVTDLKERCESALCRCDITDLNVWTFFENALLLNSEPLRRRCVQVLRHQLKRAVEHSPFLSISFNTMESVLSLDDLDVSEEKLLKNVVLWAEHQSSLEGGESFENCLKPLLPNIRFGALTAREFIELRRHSRLQEVLSPQDCLAILEHLVHPKMYELPPWCCTKRRQSTEPPPPPEKLDLGPFAFPLRSRASRKGRRTLSPSSSRFVRSSASSSSTTLSTDSSSSSSEDSD